MKKFNKVLSTILSFSLIGGICHSYKAMTLKDKLKNQAKNIVNRNDNKKNDQEKKKIIDLNKIKNNIKSKVENQKDKIEDKLNKAKKSIEKNINENVNKVKDSVKKSTEKIEDKFKEKTEITEKNDKNSENKNKKENKLTNFNSSYIPISIKSTSPYTKAIVTDILMNKIFNENKLDKDIIEYNQNTLNKNYDLFSILLNKNFIPGINISTDEKNLNDLTNKVKSNEFKNFVKNIKITEKDFNESKERIKRYLEQQKQNIEKNIDELKNKKNKKIDLSNLLSESKNQNEINNKIYNDGIREFLKKYDHKLYEKVESRIKNSAFDNAFFRDSLKYSKEFLIEKLNETLNKINSKNGLIEELNKLKYNEEIKNMKIEANNIEKYDIANNKRGIVNLYGIEETNKYFLYSPEILAYGYFNALKLSDNEKKDFKDYYKKRLDETKTTNNDKNKWRMKEIVDLYFGRNSFLKKHFNKDEYEKQKNEIEKEENTSKFFDLFKNTKSTYYETFVNKLEKI